MIRGAPKVPIPVCIVADNCLVAAYLSGLLSQDSGIRPISLKSLHRSNRRSDANLIYVVEASGLSSPLGQCLRLLSNASKGCRFLVVDEERSIDEVARLLLLGAHGFLPHSQVGARLAGAVRFLAKGHFCVPPGAFERYLTQVRMRMDGRGQVTPRESEVLDLLRMRLSNKEIAEFLRIRVSTVKFHVTHILSKLQVCSRHDLFSNDLRTILDKLPS